MTNVLPLTIESLVSILLLLTILYCIRLNEQLAGLVPVAAIGGIASSGKRCHFRRL